MSTIKCPACWNEIPQESNMCPRCGFALREKNRVNRVKDEEYPRPSDYQHYVSRPAVQMPSVQKTKANEKRIIGAAVIAIILILAIGIGGRAGKKSAENRYDYKPGYTASSGTSNYSSYTVTTGPEGALNKAKSYLNSSAFSYTGLIEQLEYEGFSSSEAIYGADHCGADWKEQALKKAKSYLNSSSFSESGLLEQLEYEGFTSEQASYGVANCGANWKEQAAKKAASYLRSHTSWTRSELISQLEYEGFTYDQASYGASQNGL